LPWTGLLASPGMASSAWGTPGQRPDRFVVVAVRMPVGEPGRAERSRLATYCADLLDTAGLTVAVAESLTGGMLASALAEAPGASKWFRGAVVAYASEVKHKVLGVPPGPVVSADAAATMAEGVRELLGADLGVAVTGAGGPRGQDDQPPGTVFIGLVDTRQTQVEYHYFERDNPAEICAETVTEALRQVLRHLRSQAPD
jgi:nicotinamide-nucleotide amidase